jgi:hypothetical protein
VLVVGPSVEAFLHDDGQVAAGGPLRYNIYSVKSGRRGCIYISLEYYYGLMVFAAAGGLKTL